METVWSPDSLHKKGLVTKAGLKSGLPEPRFEQNLVTVKQSRQQLVRVTGQPPCVAVKVNQSSMTLWSPILATFPCGPFLHRLEVQLGSGRSRLNGNSQLRRDVIVTQRADKAFDRADEHQLKVNVNDRCRERDVRRK